MSSEKDLSSAKEDGPLSILELVMPRLTFDRLIKRARKNNSFVPDEIHKAVSLRRLLEDIRDGVVEEYSEHSENSRITLQEIALDSQVDFDAILSVSEPCEIKITMPPSYLSSLDQRASREGFNDVPSYITAAIMFYEQMDDDTDFTIT